jgi:hypothetical protein
MGFQPMPATLKVKTFQLGNPSSPLAVFDCFENAAESKCALRFGLGFLKSCISRSVSVVGMGWKPQLSGILIA